MFDVSAVFRNTCCRNSVSTTCIIILAINQLNAQNHHHHHHHHHHHVPEGLGMLPVPWSSRWSWSLHLFLGRPMFLRPFGLYCSACFGSLFVSILCTWCSHFSWYCFISFTMFCAPVFCLIHWFLCTKSYFIISSLYASTCFTHYVLIIRRSKIVLYSIWYHHTCRWPSGAQVERAVSVCARDGHLQVWWYQRLHNTIFDLLMMSTWCSKHVEAWNKLIVKQILCIKLVNY